MTTEAWVNRDLQRNKLLDRLLRQALEEESKDPVLLFDIGIALCAHLKQRKRNAPRHDMYQIPPFFFEVVFLEIHEFARSQAEEDSLLAKFLEHIVKTISVVFHQKCTREEEHNPQLIFQAPSAMTEVSLG